MPWVMKRDAKSSRSKNGNGHHHNDAEEISYWCCFCNTRLFKYSEYGYEMRNGYHACLSCAFLCFVDVLDDAAAVVNINTVENHDNKAQWNEENNNHNHNHNNKKNANKKMRLLL